MTTIYVLRILAVVLLLALPVAADPSINPVDEELTDGNQIIISGSFGSKNHDEAILFDDIVSVDAYAGYDTSHNSIVPTRGSYGTGEGNPLQDCAACPWYNHNYGRVPRFYNGPNSRYQDHPTYWVKNLADTDSRKGFFARDFDIDTAEGWTYLDWWFRASHDFGEGPGGSVSGKVLRLWHNSNTVDQLVLTNMPSSAFVAEMHGCGDIIVNDYFPSLQEQRWYHIGIITHISPTEVKSWAVINGALIALQEDFCSHDGIYDYIRMLGYDPSIPNNIDPDMEFLFGDVYFDDSLASVIIADSSSFDLFGNNEQVQTVINLRLRK